MARTRDMTQGSILREIIIFALPLMLGNAFQMLYNTVDVIVNQHDFCEKAAAATPKTAPEPTDDFMQVPDGVDDDELPFG